MRLVDIFKLDEERRRRALCDLVAQATSPRSEAQAARLDARIEELERRYGMTSVEMQIAFARGEVPDTADVARWLILLAARGSRTPA